MYLLKLITAPYRVNFGVYKLKSKFKNLKLNRWSLTCFYFKKKERNAYENHSGIPLQTHKNGYN